MNGSDERGQRPHAGRDDEHARERVREVQRHAEVDDERAHAADRQRGERPGSASAAAAAASRRRRPRGRRRPRRSRSAPWVSAIAIGSTADAGDDPAPGARRAGRPRRCGRNGLLTRSISTSVSWLIADDEDVHAPAPRPAWPAGRRAGRRACRDVDRHEHVEPDDAERRADERVRAREAPQQRRAAVPPAARPRAVIARQRAAPARRDRHEHEPRERARAKRRPSEAAASSARRAAPAARERERRVAAASACAR